MWVLVTVVAVGAAALIGSVFGWRWVFAPLLGWALLTWMLGSLRALTTPSRDAADLEDEPIPVDSSRRTMFWCQECGTEVLLLVRGSRRAPSHCGQRMHERTEMIG